MPSGGSPDLPGTRISIYLHVNNEKFPFVLEIISWCSFGKKEKRYLVVQLHYSYFVIPEWKAKDLDQIYFSFKAPDHRYICFMYGLLLCAMVKVLILQQVQAQVLKVITPSKNAEG